VTEPLSQQPASDIAELLRSVESYLRDGATGDLFPNLGSDVLDAIERFLSRFIVYPNVHARRAHVLWIAHTWLMDCWYYTPRLLFTSPEPNCGKGTAFRVTQHLVPHPETIGDMSVAAFYATIDEASERFGGLPTILYDQIDTVFGPHAGMGNAELRNLIDIGFDRSMTRRRKIGKESVRFSPFAAMAMTGAMSLYDVPSDIKSRSLVIRMQRRQPPERLGRRAKELENDAAPLRDLLQMWVELIHAAAFEYLPDIPDGVADRTADMWEPLLAVAELAGGHWVDDARVTAVTAVTALADVVAPSRGVLLLWAIEDVFDSLSRQPVTLFPELSPKDVVFTERLVGELKAADKMWAAVTPIKLALQLSDYGIRPKTQRIGHQVAKGYRREYFTDAWASFPRPHDDDPPPRAVTPVTPVTPGAGDE
jgi:hypothetical protein